MFLRAAAQLPSIADKSCKDTGAGWPCTTLLCREMTLQWIDDKTKWLEMFNQFKIDYCRAMHEMMW